MAPPTSTSTSKSTARTVSEETLARNETVVARTRVSAVARPNQPSSTPRPAAPARPRSAAPRTDQVVLVTELRAPAAEELSDRVLGRSLSILNQVVGAFGGVIAAVLGAKVVALFPPDRVHDAVGAAVTIARRAPVPDNDASWAAASSIVMGARHRAEAVEGLPVVPVGPAIDLGLDLCRGALTATVLADEASGATAVMLAGLVDVEAGWSLGGQRLLVGQGSEAIACREIEFRRRDGADPVPSIAPAPSIGKASIGKAPSIRTSSGGSAPAPAPERRSASRPTGSRPAAPPPATELDGGDAGPRRSWSHGRVCCWFGDRGRGVISSSTGQEFYVDRRFLVVSSDLDPGTGVFFVPRDPVARGRNPVAGAVLVEGAQIEARVEHVDDRGFGFAQLTDSNGTRQLLLVDLSSLGTITAGEWLLVEVKRSAQGPIAVPVLT